MKRSIVRHVSRVLLFVVAFAVPVWAAEQATAPIVITAGKISAPTVLTEAAGVNPIAVGDLPTLSSAQLATLLSDETGSGLACFATSPSLTTPSIAGATLTGTINASGSTMQLPADAVDSIGEIADAILGGSTHGPKLATQTASPTAERCARWNADGVLDSHSADCGSAALGPPFFSEGQFPFPGGDVNTFMTLAGNISDTTGQAQSIVSENMTVGGCRAVWVGDPGTGVVVTLASGTYGGSLSDSSIAITLTATNTSVTDADTLALTAGQGVNWKVDQAADTDPNGQLRIACKRTA